MVQVITAPEQVTPTWLTAVLRREGVLDEGWVESVTIESNPAFNSAISHFHVRYAFGASPNAPQALVLKCNVDSEWGREAGKSEAEFYAIVRSLRDELPMIVPCYDAIYEPATGDSHLLLLDLSRTHEPPVSRDDLIALRGVPLAARLEAVVESVARFHAYWWEHPSLADGSRDISGWYGTYERFREGIERRRERWDIFLAGPGAGLPAGMHSLYVDVLERLPVLWDRGLGERFTSATNLTLVHGDCYLSQFLCPRSGSGRPYLVDWQGAYTDLPAIDLTHLFAAFWTPEQRREGDRERRLLQRYLETLRAAGVTGYGWEELQYDYRLLLTYMIFYPVWDAMNGSDKGYWWPKMQCLTAAYRDWACQDLLT